MKVYPVKKPAPKNTTPNLINKPPLIMCINTLKKMTVGNLSWLAALEKPLPVFALQKKKPPVMDLYYSLFLLLLYWGKPFGNGKNNVYTQYMPFAFVRIAQFQKKQNKTK